MILIVTKADLDVAQPMSEDAATKLGIPFTAESKMVLLNAAARQAATIAETVWLRGDDGKTIVVKSRVGTPIGTPVTLFNVAEFFGIKVTIDSPTA